MKMRGLFLGFVFGVFASWLFYVQFVSKERPSESSIAFPMSELLLISQYKIADANWNCELASQHRTVAAVLESVFKSNSESKLNKLNFQCATEEAENLNCSIGLSDCKFGFSSECSSRTLGFQTSKSGEILTDSLKCLDLP